MNKKGVDVYDIETLKSAFTYVGIDRDTGIVSKFIIHKDLNDIKSLVNHIRSLKGMIGFNVIGFDYPIIHMILKDYNNWSSLTNQEIIDIIYNKAQQIISVQNDTNKLAKYSVQIKPKDYIIPQLDLFKIHHFDNKARMTSLKALEIAMQMDNVMDMPIDHKKEDITLDEVINVVLPYNQHDVEATLMFYKLSIPKIDLRRELTKKYGCDFMNDSDSRIGEQLTLELYCKKTGLDKWDVRKMNSPRKSIDLKDCILPYVVFKGKPLNDLLNKLKSTTVTGTKGIIDDSILINGFKYDFGLGGIHGCCKAGVYESDDKNVIKSLDVASLYPSLAVLNGFYPEHLGKDFIEVYKGILDQRIEAKKSGNMVLSDGFKLSLNSVYGKSNDTYSFLYDPLYTLKTTLNGQFLLCMLAEELQLAGFTMLMINTDGLECIVPVDKVDIYEKICSDWEKLTRLTLEFVNYDKLIVRDINNYISITDKGKVKRKGAFVIDREYHQDHSFKIIPHALTEFFINGVPVEDTIRNHTNIFDFCGRQKFGKDSYGETHTVAYDKNNLPFNDIVKQQKNVRYYISNQGSTFIKQYTKKKQQFLNKGFQIIVFNQKIDRDMKDYNINYDFYINECNKEIEQIIDKQLILF